MMLSQPGMKLRIRKGNARNSRIALTDSGLFGFRQLDSQDSFDAYQLLAIVVRPMNDADYEAGKLAEPEP